MAESIFWAILSNIGHNLPLLLAALGGLIFALVLIGRQPRPAVFVLAGAGLLLLTELLFAVWYPCVPWLFSGGGFNVDRLRMMGWVSTISRVFHHILQAVAIGLLVTAAFIGRGRAAPARVEPEARRD